MPLSPYQIEVSFTASCDNCIHQGLCESLARKGRLCTFWRGNRQADIRLSDEVHSALRDERDRRRHEEELQEAKAIVAAYEERINNPTEEDVERARVIIAEVGSEGTGD